MTIPWFENCPHCENGWCLNCVAELGEQLMKALDIIDQFRENQLTTIKRLDVLTSQMSELEELMKKRLAK